jgi:hypothetical protein
MDLQPIKDQIDSSPSLLALNNDYPAIAAILSERPEIDNPEPIQQVPDLPSFGQLTHLATDDEWSAIDAIDNVDQWGGALISSVGLASPEVKQLLRAIATAAPEQWEGSLFDLIRYGLETIEDPSAYPRINGDFIFPDATPADPNPHPRSLLNALGTVLVEQGILSLDTFLKMAARLQRTKDDPNYSPKILGDSWAMLNGYGEVSAEQVRSAKRLK